MTARVNLTRFFHARWAIAACRSLTGVVSAVLVLSLLSGTGAAQTVQALAAKHTPALAVLAAGKLTLVQNGAPTAIGPVGVRGTTKPMTVTDFQWSSSGRYLGWEQSNPNTGRGAIGWYDTVSHRRMSW